MYVMLLPFAATLLGLRRRQPEELRQRFQVLSSSRSSESECQRKKERKECDRPYMIWYVCEKESCLALNEDVPDCTDLCKMWFRGYSIIRRINDYGGVSGSYLKRM